MPGGDRTGPMGYGPMTGRGMGWCARPGGGGAYGPVRGNWFGGGRGRGWRHCYYATGARGWARPGWGGWMGGPTQYFASAPAEEELVNLREYSAGLERELADIKARMVELEQERKSSTASTG
jgi:hypothetical protein